MRPRFRAYLLCFFFIFIFVVGKGQNTIKYTGSTTFCQGASTTLTASPSGTKYQWSFNNKDTVTTSSFTVNQSGTINVIVNGNTYAPVTITVNPNPIANFTFSPISQCANVPVNFTNTSSGNGLSYAWNFGDANSGVNNTSTNANPVHRFIGTAGNSSQSFTVTLTVTSADGCIVSTIKTATIKQSPGTQLDGPSPSTYNGLNYFKDCTGSSSAALDFSNISSTTNTFYKIVWGDNTPDFVSTSFVGLQTHTYNTGTYSLYFIVSGSNGCIDTGFYSIFIGSNPGAGLPNPGNSTICTGSFFTFPVTETANNNLETTYTITFSDGSPVLKFNQPPPTSVTHKFDASSCGFNTNNYKNSFSAVIVASNACLTTTNTAEPIYVSQKPIASITTLPSDTVCINTATTVTNSSTSNTYVSASTCVSGRSVWTVSPATGWTLNSGNLGNDNNSPNPGSWSSLSTMALSLNFNTIGTFTIRLKTGNPTCGQDSITKTICVNPAPVSSFKVDNNVGCAGLTVKTTNNSNAPNCGNNTYAWSVNYTSISGCLPTTAAYTYVANTNATSINPQFNFTNPGIYTIGLVTTSPGGTCTANAPIQQITIKGKPTATIAPLANACQNSLINPSSTPTCYVTTAPSYLWGFANGSPSSSTSLNPGNITYSLPGTYSITLSVTNECGTTIAAPQQLTVNQTPDIAKPADQKTCNGSFTSDILFSSTLVGTTFTWTNSNTIIGLAASGTSNILSFKTTNNTASIISSTITVTPLKNGCTGTPVSFTITVYPTPSTPTIVTPITYCQNTTAIPLTATAAANNTLNWYTAATGGTASSTTPTPSTTTVGTFYYYVSQSNGGNCEGTRTTITVTVDATPTITATPSNPTSCGSATGSIIINGLVKNTNYTINYTYGGAITTAPYTSNGFGTITITTLKSGTYNNIFVTLLSCSSNTISTISLSDPLAPTAPTATSVSPICSGTTLSLNTTAVTNANYSWSGPSFSSTFQNPTIATATTAATGTYSVTVTVKGCTSAAGTVNVIVNQTPLNITAKSNTPICSGNALNFIASTTTSGAVTYAWTGPNNYTDATQSPTVSTNATTNMAGVYKVVATLGNCSDFANTATVVINPRPTISGTSTSPSNCVSPDGSITLSGLANSANYTVSYQYNSTLVTKSLTTSSTGNITISNLAAGNYTNVGATTAVGCISNLVGPFILTTPTQPTTPIAITTSNNPLCSGGTINFSISNPVVGTYNWTGPNGFSTSSQNPLIAKAITAATGTYQVTVTVNGCVSNAGTVDVKVDSTPTISISGSGPICSGNTLSLTSSTATSGTVTFAWTGPNGFKSLSKDTTIINATTAASGNYQVVATLGNCSIDSTIIVAVNFTPRISDSSSISPLTCASFTGSISLVGLTSGVTYTVKYLKDGATATTNITAVGATGIVTIPNLSKGLYTNIIVTSSNCSSNSVGPFQLVDPNPPTTPTATSNTPVCTGSPLNLTSNATTLGVSYNWTGPNGFKSGSKDTTITNTTVATSGNYLVTASISGCTSAPFTVKVTVAPSAVVANAGLPQQLCNTTTSVLTGNNAGKDTGTWTIIAPSTAVVAQINNPTSSINNLPIGTTKAIWTINNAVCQPSFDTVQITVLAALANTISPISNTTCKGQTFAITGASPSGGSGTYLYQWQQSADNILFTNIAGATNVGLNISPITTTYYRRNIISGTCASSSDTTTIIVLAGIGNNTIMAEQTICINTPPLLLTGALPTGGGGAFTYSWEQSTNSGTIWTVIAGATNATYQPNALSVPTSYRRNVVTALCGGAQSSVSNVVSITINPDATALFNPTITASCAPFSITPSTINLTTNKSVGEYRWYENGHYLGSNQTFPGYVMPIAGDTITIKLVAVSAYGCKSDSIQKTFTTIVQLKPSFTQSDSVGCGPLKVTFVNTTPNQNNYSYLWNFGMGPTSTLAQPGSITFPSSPTYGDTTYPIKFKAMGTCDTITLTSYVRVKSKPKALFTPDKSTGCSPLTVTFTNTSIGSFTVPFTWDFGDGSALLSSNAATVQHTYNVGQRDTFKVKLIAVNDCGKDSLVYAIVVQPNAIHVAFAINGSERYGCVPHTVRFINNTSGANTFVWDFGDGSSLLGTVKGIDTISHTYTSAGNFTTTLKASNSCSDTSAVQVTTAFAKPTVSINAYPLTACIGDSIHFINLSDSGVSNLWQFGDGTSSFNRSPAKAYVLPGNFGVKYIASHIYTNGTVCADSSALNIIIRDTLPGTFQISNTTSSCAPFAVTVKYTSGGSLQTKWDFGDGTTSLGDSVVHIYMLPGVYNLRMYVKENVGGCISMASQRVTIGGVSGSFSYQSGFTCLNSPVSFKGIGSNASLYTYFFGDGDSLITSTTPVLHSFNKPGYYFPTVVLMNGSCSLTVKGLDTIKVDMGKPGFLINTQFICASTSIQFTDTSFSYFGIKNYTWNFGDGSQTSILQNPMHNFTTAGTYYIALKILGTSGCTDTVTVPISVAVHNYPASNIGGDTAACTNQPLALIANVQSIDSIQSRNWTFGNNTTASGIYVHATYNNVGSYSIRLISRTSFGCTDTTYKTVKVNITPTIFTGADVTICKGQSVQITATGANKLNWFPTQGLSCITCASPVATPNFTTNYYAIGTNRAGCSASDTVIVNVVQPLVLSISSDDTICIGSHAQLNATNAYSYIWNPATGLNNSNIPNPIATPTYTTKYRIIGTDASNCFVDTAYVVVAVGQYPVVNFGSTGGLVIAGTAIQLTPTITNGPIINYRWTPTQDLSCTNCANPIATINNDVTYILQAGNEYGCKGSDTISYKVNCASSQVFIANAFSPDGDGVNDILFVQGKGISIVKYFRIFNRWGQMVFERSNFNINDSSTGWDGKVNGVLATTDVYVFTAEVLCTAGSTFVYKGNVTLVR